MEKHKTSFLILAAFLLLALASGYGCKGGVKKGEGAGEGTPDISALGGNISSIKLVKTNGIEVDFTARPIPLGTTVQITFENSVPSEDEQKTIIDAFKLKGPGQTDVPGAWTWNEDFNKATFKPTKRLDYRTQYTLEVAAVETTATPSTLSKSIEAGSFPFTTMTRGDINGDGYADLLIGATGWDGSQPGLGAAYVFNGSESGLSSTYAKRVNGNGSDDGFGMTWSTADVNGDGYEDAIVGEGEYDGKGAAYIYHGSADGISTTPSTTLIGPSWDALGYSVGGAGDVNGDRFDDIIVGAPGHANGALTEAGAAYIYHGSADGISTTPSSTLLGATANAYLGFFVSTAGDVNGDGIDDVCVSGHYSAGSNYANVYLGSSSGIVTAPSPELTGENAGDVFGISCHGAGDVNGDGFDDLIVGAIGYPGGANQGALYVYNGSAGGIKTTPARKLVGENNGDTFGAGAPTGDINGDGFDDIVVGALSYDGNKGKAYIYQGSASGIPASATNAILSSSQQLYGMVSPGMDFNGDGYSDIVVGAPGYDNMSMKGAAYIYNGSASGMKDTPLILTGEADGDFFSGWVSP